MTFSRLWAFLAVALPTLAALIASLSTVDLAYQLRAGAQILDGHGIPALDTWTFTAAGARWVDQQWGAQLALAAVYRVAGWTGLVILRAGLVAVIFACLFKIGQRRGIGVRVAALLTLAAFVVAAPALALRPQLIGMALFAVVLLLVTDRRRHPGGLWLVPLVVVAWANIHGSFFLGPVVLGLAWLEDVHDRVPGARRPLAVALVSAAAASLTPFGPAVWAYAVGLSTNPEVTARITEWQPSSLRDVTGLIFFASVLGVAALIARSGRVTAWPTLAWLAVFAGIGAYAARGIAWWPLAAVPAVAAIIALRAPAPGPIAAVEPADTPLVRRLNAAVAVLLVVIGILLLPAWRPVEPGLGAPVGVLTDAPVGITAALRRLARPGDRLMNPQPWGSWFEFSVPDVTVSIDSRIELFPVEVWQGHERILAGPDGWAEQREAWGVTLVVLTPLDADANARLTAVSWRTLYHDEAGSILAAPGR